MVKFMCIYDVTLIMCAILTQSILYFYMSVCVCLRGKCECLHIILTLYSKAGGWKKKKVSYLNPPVGTTDHVNSGFSILQTK